MYYAVIPETGHIRPHLFKSHAYFDRIESEELLLPHQNSNRWGVTDQSEQAHLCSTYYPCSPITRHENFYNASQIHFIPSQLKLFCPFYLLLIFCTYCNMLDEVFQHSHVLSSRPLKWMMHALRLDNWPSADTKTNDHFYCYLMTLVTG